MTTNITSILGILHEMGEATRLDLQERLGLTKSNVMHSLHRMRRANQSRCKLIYVKSWRANQDGEKKAHPRPVYALGNLPDEPKPKGTMRNGEGLLGPGKQAMIIDSIKANGPMLRIELTQRLGILRADLSPMIQGMLRPTGGRRKLLYVVAWEYVKIGVVSNWYARVGIGDHPDAERPKEPPPGAPKPAPRRRKEGEALRIPQLSKTQRDTALGRCRTSIFDFA